jgi:type 1 fimbria pilin
MRFLNFKSIFILLTYFFVFQVHAEDELTCQLNTRLNFNGFVPEILAKSATVSIGVQTNQSDTLILGCSETAKFTSIFQIDSLSDLNVQKSLKIGQYTFYKLRSVQGRTTGNLAIDFLVNHAYLAFSIRNSEQTQHINSYAQNQDIILNNNDLDVSNSSLSIVDTQLYIDELPDNELLIEQLNRENIILKLGQFQVKASTQNSSEDVAKDWQANLFPSLHLNIAGITFKNPTCVFLNQTIILPTLSVTEFKSSAPTAAGIPQAFDLNFQCNGYLNQRKFSMTWIDNYQIDHINNVGYLSPEKVDGMSNVGVQIKDHLGEPIKIGQSFDLNDAATGTSFQKTYTAQYYLAQEKATVGKVNAQAILTIEYR